MAPVGLWRPHDNWVMALQQAVENNCDKGADCTCPAHKMLSDHNVLHHMAFVNSVVIAYIQAEFDA